MWPELRCSKPVLTTLRELRCSKPVLTTLHELRCSKPVYLHAKNWGIHNPCTNTPLWKETFTNPITYTTWTEIFTTCLPKCPEMRCLNPIRQYSSILRCEQFVYNTSLTKMFATSLPTLEQRCSEPAEMQLLYWHVQPVSSHFLNCDVHNLLIHLPWNEMPANCLPIWGGNLQN
jgi:hypothetical protein